jgi:hypothetical protein
MHRFAGLAPQPAGGLAGQMRKQSGEHLPGTAGVGVRQGRARHLLAAQMIQPAGVARERRFDLAQAVRSRQLRAKQGDQLGFRAQFAHMLVGIVPVHQPLKTMPGHVLQYPVKYAILMQHGVAPFRVANVGKTSKHRRIHAMRPVQQN